MGKLIREFRCVLFISVKGYLNLGTVAHHVSVKTVSKMFTNGFLTREWNADLSLQPVNLNLGKLAS